MFDSIMGLPAHPLIVHGAVVLVPLAALAGLLAVGWSAVRDKAALVALVITSIAGVFVVAAGESGEKLEERVPETPLVETHAEMGETLLPIVAGLWLGLAIIVVLAWYTARNRDAAGRTVIRLAGVVAMVVVVFAAIGSTVQVGRIGHSGAKAVWNDVGAGQGTPSEKGEDGE
jgi:hypothetical protein